MSITNQVVTHEVLKSYQMIQLGIYDMRKFNSVTKYPSIEVMHKFDPVIKGRLINELNVVFPPKTSLRLSEKIDGENCRIVVVVKPGEIDYFIGSREEWLTAKGDRVQNKHDGVVDTVISFCEDLCNRILPKLIFKDPSSGYVISKEECDHAYPLGIYTIYPEVYGGKINGYKQYTSSGKGGFRVFDISYTTFDECFHLLTLEIKDISSWRQHGGQRFLPLSQRDELCEWFGLEIVPDLGIINSDELPLTIEGMHEMIKMHGKSKAGIDADGDSEGFVIRTDDRKLITKCRKEDYEKAMRPPPQQQKKRQ